MDAKTIRELVNVMKGPDKATSSYDTTAEVTRVEDDVVWVHIPGGIDETPVAMTINAKEGDTVRVRLSGGRAWLVGSDTAPPTDDTKANDAGEVADRAEEKADSAQDDADRAKTAAELAEGYAVSAQNSANNANEYASRALGNLSTVQSVAETLAWITEHGTMTITSDTEIDPTHVYFVADENGDYVVGNTHYSVVTEPTADSLSSYYELSIDESLNNYVGTHLAVTDEGLWVLPAATGYKVLIATGNGTTYTDAGTYIIDPSGNTVASFGEAAQIGELRSSHVLVDDNSLKMIDKEGGVYAYISDLRDGSGIVEHILYVTSLVTSTATTDWSITLPSGAISVNSVNGNGDEVVSYSTTSSGDRLILTFTVSTATRSIKRLEVDYDGYPRTVVEARAYTFGYRKSGENIGSLSFAEGQNTIASQYAAHAEGYGSRAIGNCSHAEGGFTNGSLNLLGGKASGDSSHAEGINTEASGNHSHAEGYGSKATGQNSHAQNQSTIAVQEDQTAIGRFNAEDTAGDYVFIIGNGSSNSSRSDAVALTWDGDFHIFIDSSAAVSTSEGKFYKAIDDLGWISEVSV